MPYFPIKGFAPDSDPFEDPGLLQDATNIVMTTRSSVIGFPLTTTTVGTTTGSVVQTLVYAPENNGRNHLLFANGWQLSTSSKIYEAVFVSGTGFRLRDRSASAGTYTMTGRAVWTAAQYGDDQFFAQKGVVIQHADLSAFGGSGSASCTSTNSNTGSFSALPTAPHAVQVEVALDFVLAFNVDDSEGLNQYGNVPDGWACSAAGVVDSWSADIATQANYGRITHAPGPITAARRLGNDVVVWKRYSMFRGRYVGTPIVWAFDQIPGDYLGAYSPGHVISIDNAVLWCGPSGFWYYDGTRPQPIGDNRIKDFYNRFCSEAHALAQTFHDPWSKNVFWCITPSGKTTPTHYLSFNYVSGAWGFGDQNICAAVATHDGSNLGGGTGWLTMGKHNETGTGWLAIGQTGDYTSVRRTGNDNFSFTTGYVGTDDRLTTVTRVRPRFRFKHGSNQITGAHYSTNTEDTMVTRTTGIVLTRGALDHVHSARWHQFRVTGTGTAAASEWEIMGLNVEVQRGGKE